MSPVQLRRAQTDAVITVDTARRLLENYRGDKMNVRSKLRGYEQWWSGSATIFKYVEKLIQQHSGKFPTSDMTSIWRDIDEEAFSTGEQESWEHVQKQNEQRARNFTEQVNTHYYEGELNAAEKKLYLSWSRITGGVEAYGKNARAHDDLCCQRQCCYVEEAMVLHCCFIPMLLHMGKAHYLAVTTLDPWQCPLRGHAHMMMSNVYLSNRQI